MTAEKRKLIADAWCEVQIIIEKDNERKPPYYPVRMRDLIPDALSSLKRRRAVWEKHGLLGDPDVEEWLAEHDLLLSTSYPQ